MLGFVGCGNMAQAMLKGILAKGLYKADEIIVSRRTKEALDALHEELGVQITKKWQKKQMCWYLR